MVNFRSKLISQYAAVWSLAMDKTLPALSHLEDLKQTPQLKYKIVFSVVVVSFRISDFTSTVYSTMLAAPIRPERMLPVTKKFLTGFFITTELFSRNYLYNLFNILT